MRGWFAVLGVGLEAKLVLRARKEVVGDTVEEERLEGFAGGRKRDDRDANCKNDERNPARDAEIAVQKADAEDGRGENLSLLALHFEYAPNEMTYFKLVQDLEMDRV